MRTLLVIACLLTGGIVSAAEPKPNVLLICIDDLKPTLGCYGDQLARSPNIDKLAARGVRFDRAYCNQAVCSPSRNSLLVGLRSQTLGIYDLGTNFRRAVPDAVTLPQYFKQNGYRTEAMGKLFHVGPRQQRRRGLVERAAFSGQEHWLCTERKCRDGDARRCALLRIRTPRTCPRERCVRIGRRRRFDLWRWQGRR
jgi:hypothetical protein